MFDVTTAIWIFFVLGCGPLNTIISKIVFEIRSIGVEGFPKPFHKPWFITTVMFLGMAPGMVVYIAKMIRNKTRRHHQNRQPLLQVKAAAEPEPMPFWKSALYCALPASFDMIGTTVGYIGLLYNSPSVFMMLRGSIIVFSAILSVVFLHRKLNGQNWFGVIVCAAAVTLIGVSNLCAQDAKEVADEPEVTSVGLMAFGMLMILLSQFIQALQVVTEEKFMKDMTIDPYCVVGMEGVWGTIYMVCIVLPILYAIPGDDAGSSENTLDSLMLFEHSKKMQTFLAVYVVSIFFTNCAAVIVTKILSAIHVTMFNAMQPAIVWFIGLFTYYLVTPAASFAEQWTAWSWLQLGGFLFLVYGQLVYADILHVPGFKRPIVQQAMPFATPTSVTALVPSVGATRKNA
ncbi:conserved hypothetical protein [Perkinsus marinus ATCC 50983]|uniref:EamA domain-containing protein n=1 Tax=Perkinsus marinus (strain ATCC 50983 / TXsc) TaxID=423536 RepID=C5LKT2_PERM5|nr:conserved hypothetical protein [Perkinsus marinus ATCC 50983]EER02662.1 conserved hypothetical protein [Perkinsus marinus ATCC 50983]|eukprot:XP_002769944.1 conserved hypothetical protein [Perkinsus marinus ATCC 50983]